MRASAAIATGLALGLSSGGYCFWSCASVMAPYLVSTETSTLNKRWASVAGICRALGWYNLGRLVAYLAVGIVVSLVAGSQRIPHAIQAVAHFATALLLGFAVVRPSGRSRCWHGRGHRAGGALVIGILQGLAPCPPFLMAIGLALTTPDLMGGILLFLSLFAGTALFTLPLVFLEPLRRSRWLFWIMRGLGALVCVYLLIRALILCTGDSSV
jgi:sulfite exporter TauE/SafE